MKMPNKILSTVALAAMLGWAGAAHSATQTFDPLPAPDCGITVTNNCIQFGDFSVYSLALLAAQAGAIPPFNTTDPYFVQSSPGELANPGYIVYGTGTGNPGVVINGAGTLIDNAQSQPTGSTTTFVVGAATETAPTFTGDLIVSWDGTLSAIRDELAAGSDPTGDFVIYFNLNETGNDGLAGIDLLTWFHIQLVDLDGGLAPIDFYLFGGNPDGTGATYGQAPDINNLADPNWVYVHGTICVTSASEFLSFGPCSDAQKAAGGHDLNQNLGADQAAFAIFNQELSDLVLDPLSGYDIISGTWMFAAINNGFEQEFSALTQVGQQVPEPGTLLLFGMGLTSLVLLRSRKNRGSKSL